MSSTLASLEIDSKEKLKVFARSLDALAKVDSSLVLHAHKDNLRVNLAAHPSIFVEVSFASTFFAHFSLSTDYSDAVVQVNGKQLTSAFRNIRHAEGVTIQVETQQLQIEVWTGGSSSIRRNMVIPLQDKTEDGKYSCDYAKSEAQNSIHLQPSLILNSLDAFHRQVHTVIFEALNDKVSLKSGKLIDAKGREVENVLRTQERIRKDDCQRMRIGCAGQTSLPLNDVRIVMQLMQLHNKLAQIYWRGMRGYMYVDSGMNALDDEVPEVSVRALLCCFLDPDESGDDDENSTTAANNSAQRFEPSVTPARKRRRVHAVDDMSTASSVFVKNEQADEHHFGSLQFASHNSNGNNNNSVPAAGHDNTFELSHRSNDANPSSTRGTRCITTVPPGSTSNRNHSHTGNTSNATSDESWDLGTVSVNNTLVRQALGKRPRMQSQTESLEEVVESTPMSD